MHSSGNLVADTICRTAEIGLTITGAADAGNITIIDAAPVAVSDACPECSQPGTKRVHFPGFGPARLLDMRPGRSAEVLRTWLQERTPDFREHVQVVTMDGFAGYATAVDQALPQARKVMDPFHVVHLAADKLDLLSATPAT